MNSTLFAALALVPALLGPLPDAPRRMTAVLCTGAGAVEIEVQFPAERSPLTAPCHAKGCRASSRREKIDLAQGR